MLNYRIAVPSYMLQLTGIDVLCLVFHAASAPSNDADGMFRLQSAPPLHSVSKPPSSGIAVTAEITPQSAVGVGEPLLAGESVPQDHALPDITLHTNSEVTGP